MLLNNVIYNSIGRSLQLILALIAVPFYLKGLGVADYGVYITVSTFVGFFGVLDFGLGYAVTKYISEHRSDKRELYALLDTAIFIQFVLALLLSVLIFVFSNQIASLLNGNSNHIVEIEYAVRIASIILFVSMLSVVAISIIKGYEHFDYVAKTYVIVGGVTTLVGIVLVYSGYGLIGLMLVELMSALSMFIISIFLIKSIENKYSIGLRISRHHFNKLLVFGGLVSLTRIASQFYNRIPNIVIAIMLGAEFVPLYAVPAKIVNAVKTIINSAGEVFFPRASMLSSTEGRSELKVIYLNSSRYFAFLCSIFYFYIISMSQTILSFWVGDEFSSQSWLILGILSLSALLSGVTTIPVNIALGIGKAKLISMVALYVLFVSAVMIYPCVKLFGNIGAPIAILLSQTNVVYLFVKVNKEMGVPNYKYFINVIANPFMVIGLISAIVSLVYHNYIHSGIVTFIAASVVYGFFCLVVVCIMDRSIYMFIRKKIQGMWIPPKAVDT